MKTRRLLPRIPGAKSCTLLLFLLAMACSQPSNEVAPVSSHSEIAADDWVSLMKEYFDGPGVIVQKGNSIQEAVDAAEPGQSIYVEPGRYAESVIIDKPGIKLIGLKDDAGQLVSLEGPGNTPHSITITSRGEDVEIFNIMNALPAQLDGARSRGTEKKRTNAFQMSRKKGGSDIAHYAFDIPVGSGPFDVVRIHRVVRENRPYRPVRSRGAVFMLHGASLKFEPIFLRAGVASPSPATSVAHYLADKNIDVWGMDFGWTGVPAETSDFGFMQDWGIDKDIDHALQAMSIARLIRGITGQGFGRLNLLGYSYGVLVAYGAAGRETQQHPILRHINGIIAVDQGMKYAASEEMFRQTACNSALESKQQIDNGVYHNNSGQVFAAFAGLATSAPDDPSPFIPNLTNYQAVLFIGTSTFAQGNAAAPFWHFVGGVFDDPAVPIPSDLAYTDPARWIAVPASLPPYQPQRTIYDARSCLCNEEDVAFDDHLGVITLPILYIGAGGAFSTFGDHTSTLTWSTEITNYTVSVQPADQKIIDYGHADLFLADNAPTLVWKPLYQWLINHHSVAPI